MLDTLIKNLLKEGFQIWFTGKDTFDVMDFHYIRVFVNIKKGEGRKVLTKDVNAEEWTTHKSQKDALTWILNNYK